jgi:phosphopantothenoylcysteine decarboxylase / phosphopantothenate---cysteine ligase
MSSAVLLGVTGGIAAYKAPMLVRLLCQAELDVHVVMTRAAAHFVTPLTLATLSCNPVHEDMWANRTQPSVEHISLADTADVAVIAPATADIIGKIANGIADDLLTTVFMAVTAPILICPSMNVNMYRNPIVQGNISKLRQLKYHIMEPESGYLACGWEGEGRMPEPEAIAERVVSLLSVRDLENERILVTAGPTEEPLDPVRFLTNRSSGKMGVAVARRAVARGAEVTLIAGPIKVAPPQGVRHISVRTAQEMYDRVLEVFPETDVVVKAAAVADIRPERVSQGKMPKQEVASSLTFVRNPDILKKLGELRRPDQVLVGFAAETQEVLEHGRAKLKKKNADLLVLNDVSQPGAGFDYDTNIVRLLHRSGKEEQLDLMAKERVADIILDRVRDMREKVKR